HRAEDHPPVLLSPIDQAEGLETGDLALQRVDAQRRVTLERPELNDHRLKPVGLKATESGMFGLKPAEKPRG
ncbi:MAG: hypothetical protein H0X65_21935, partial [Gemmatimonadetes bacterium]|nr:hypothetical protein [Gemmatimonadota bacterium]